MSILAKRAYKQRFLTCIAAAAVPGLIVSPASAETVQQIVGAPGHVVWEIREPAVDKPTTDYPQITFAPGKTVTVTASGCVQTGGSGATWKRYVDPAGDESETLYHGQISIPGATPGLVNFDPRQPTVYTIPANAPGQSHLRLGYTDKHGDYGDNGYSSHDDGNLNQCWKVGPADVVVDIGPLAPLVAPPAEADYTLTINNIMIRNLRTHHLTGGGKDTDVLGTAVMVNGTQSAVGGQTIGDVKQGSVPVNFSTVVTQVRPADRLNFLYTVVNSGKPTSQATTTEVSGIVGKIASEIPVYGSVLSALATGTGDLINIFNPDCDGPVVAGSIMATGSDLALWTQNGPYTRTRTFPGIDSNTGCGNNSFYEVTYTISPTNAGPQPFSVQINARSLATKLGNSTRAFKR